MDSIVKLITIMLLLVIVGCNTVDQNDVSIDQLDPQFNNRANDVDNDDRLGFVRHSKEGYDNQFDNERIITMDRTKMADMITRVILQNDGFEEVATLVTDKEVLIAYKQNESIQVPIAADIAKKIATSVMPGYFDVYVSNNQSLMEDIHSLHNSTTQNKNYNNTIDKIIKEMKNSPQGKEDEK